MQMRPGHLGDLMAIMKSAEGFEEESKEAANNNWNRAAVFATLAVSKRLEALLHVQLYSSPEGEDELG